MRQPFQSTVLIQIQIVALSYRDIVHRNVNHAIWIKFINGVKEVRQTNVCDMTVFRQNLKQAKLMII